jgi:hypothetical protein
MHAQRVAYVRADLQLNRLAGCGAGEENNC